MLTLEKSVKCTTLWTLCEGIHWSQGNSRTKASDAELWCFLWSASEHMVEQTVETPVISEAIPQVYRHCNVRASITVTSWWAQWRLKSPVSRSFTQPFIQVQIKQNISVPGDWPFLRGIHQWPVNSPHKGPVTRKMFPFGDVIMHWLQLLLPLLPLRLSGTYWGQLSQPLLTPAVTCDDAFQAITKINFHILSMVQISLSEPMMI